MIKSLRRKFIAIAMCSLIGVLVLTVGFINTFSYIDVVNKADSRLSLIEGNNGTFPKNGQPPKDGGMRGGGKMSPEAPFETRYFTVTIGESGNVTTVDTGKIAAITTSEASEYATDLYAKNSDSGFYGNYRYKAVPKSNGTLYIFLDCSRELSSFWSFLVISILISIAGILVVFALVLIFSKIAVKPFAESYEKQKRFITDASHEIKTPLTIIEANTEVLEMTGAESEWTQSIRNQIKRLSSLTQKLVFLARMDENQCKLEMTEFSLSDAVLETADSFSAVARNSGKTLDINVQNGILLKGNEMTIRELVSVLVDNAVKYSTENGNISVSLVEESGHKKLTVKNSTTSLEKGNHDILFERFYRSDSSRNSETGGSGIGLSIAKAVATAHKAKIHAKSPDGNSLEITVVF